MVNKACHLRTIMSPFCTSTLRLSSGARSDVHPGISWNWCGWRTAQGQNSGLLKIISPLPFCKITLVWLYSLGLSTLPLACPSVAMPRQALMLQGPVPGSLFVELHPGNRGDAGWWVLLRSLPVQGAGAPGHQHHPVLVWGESWPRVVSTARIPRWLGGSEPRLKSGDSPRAQAFPMWVFHRHTPKKIWTTILTSCLVG